MKKNGFTLAEVLITLTIIGVVAVLTLPALMANTAEQQARTALRKLVNTTSMAANLNSSIAGYDYNSITVASQSANGATQPEGSLGFIFQERTAHNGGVWTPTFPNGSTAPLQTNTAVYFKDGTAVYYNSADLSNATQPNRTMPDGTKFGIPVVFDTNGTKGPNLVSTCTGGAVAGSWAGDDSGNCEPKANRFIKDQYRMRLYGNFAGPVGAASTWMLDDGRYTAGDSDKYTPSARR